jgi:sterol desaturase/sphingolipid hydroxylase (fatty acid hydroxylase superfamily)
MVKGDINRAASSDVSFMIMHDHVMVGTMALFLVMFILGLCAWTFVEYTIHGFLSHIFTTFVTPQHFGHHRDPHLVFTAGMWAPLALLSALIFGIFGMTPATAVWLGLVVGFVSYELFHYRIHFARPICALEDRMRTRHLVHHMKAPNQIFGVTNRIWDRVFGSEPEENHLAELRAAVAATAPLTGRTNFHRVFRPWTYVMR